MEDGKARTENLPKLLKEMRKKTGVSQAELSWKSGLSEAHVQRIEQGRFTNISLRAAEKLSKALGLTTFEFLQKIYREN